jgi:hypothetical protein
MKLHTGDGLQSGDASNDMKLHTGDGWQSGNVNCKQLNSDLLHQDVKIETCYVF